MDMKAAIAEEEAPKPSAKAKAKARGKAKAKASPKVKAKAKAGPKSKAKAKASPQKEASKSRGKGEKQADVAEVAEPKEIDEVIRTPKKRLFQDSDEEAAAEGAPSVGGGGSGLAPKRAKAKAKASMKRPAGKMEKNVAKDGEEADQEVAKKPKRGRKQAAMPSDDLKDGTMKVMFQKAVKAVETMTFDAVKEHLASSFTNAGAKNGMLCIYWSRTAGGVKYLGDATKPQVAYFCYKTAAPFNARMAAGYLSASLLVSWLI